MTTHKQITVEDLYEKLDEIQIQLSQTTPCQRCCCCSHLCRPSKPVDPYEDFACCIDFFGRNFPCCCVPISEKD